MNVYLKLLFTLIALRQFICVSMAAGTPKRLSFDIQADSDNKITVNLDTTMSCGSRTVAFDPHRNAKIVGGVAAPYGAFPWQVQIQMFRYDGMRFEHHCGGAVIGERLVLTAAHCIQVNYSFSIWNGVELKVLLLFRFLNNIIYGL